MVTRAILRLSELKSWYRNVPLQLSTLIGQLVIRRSGRIRTIIIVELKEFLERSTISRVGRSNWCITGLLPPAYPHLAAASRRTRLLQEVNMTARSNVSFLWNERDLMGFLSLLDCQVNALNLFLQAIQWWAWSKVRGIAIFLMAPKARPWPTNRSLSTMGIVK